MENLTIIPEPTQACALEKTLAIITPDGMSHKDDILKRITEAGFRILQAITIQLSLEQALDFYRTKAICPDLGCAAVSLSANICQVLCLAKSNAIEDWKRLAGPELYHQAIVQRANSLRALYASPDDPFRKVVHASASADDAQFEIRFFFPNVIIDPIMTAELQSAYLTQSIYPILMNGLHYIATERPVEPLLALADYLFKNNPDRPKISQPNQDN